MPTDARGEAMSRSKQKLRREPSELTLSARRISRLEHALAECLCAYELHNPNDVRIGRWERVLEDQKP